MGVQEILMILNIMEEIKIVSRILLWSFQVAAFIAAILMWQKYKNTTQRNFLFFLGFVVIIEILGYILPKQFNIKSAYIYNVFTIVSGFFYLFWFWLILKYKRLILVFVSVFLIVIFHALLFQDFAKLWKTPLIVLTILILISSTVFFSDLLGRKEAVNFKSDQKFWIVTGVLIFYIGYLPIPLLQKYLSISGIYFRLTIMILNIIMYGFLTKSFLCLKKK